jgi:hypothetical protein
MEIKDEQLREFMEWYRWHYSKDTAFEASMQISMAGRFHIQVKQTRPLIARCLALGYVQKARNHFMRIRV